MRSACQKSVDRRLDCGCEIYELRLNMQKAEEAMHAGERVPALRTEAILLGADFRGRASSLFRLLQSDALQGGLRGAQLRQLLLRLNFNHFLDDTQKPAADASDHDQQWSDN